MAVRMTAAYAPSATLIISRVLNIWTLTFASAGRMQQNAKRSYVDGS